MDIKIHTIHFGGSQIPTIKHPDNGIIYVAVKPIVDALGIDWKNQHEKITQHYPDEYEPIMLEVPQEHLNRSYSQVCIPLTRVNSFLFSINYRRIPNPDVRERVRLYQMECHNVLRDYWLFGIAVNSRETPYDQGANHLDYGKAARMRLQHFTNLFAEQDPDLITFMHNRTDAMLQQYVGTSDYESLRGLDAIRIATVQEIISRAVAAAWRSQINFEEGLVMIDQWVKEGINNLGTRLMTPQIVFQKDDGTCF